jgi:hypothetical protein
VKTSKKETVPVGAIVLLYPTMFAVRAAFEPAFTADGEG